MSISLMGTIENTCMEEWTLHGGPVKTTKEKLKKGPLVTHVPTTLKKKKKKMLYFSTKTSKGI